jgi:iron complex transport system permease protein
MKITIDVDRLLAEGHIDQDEYIRLKSFATEDTGSLAFNILIGFGVIAATLGAMALLPSSGTAITLGLVLSVAGIFFQAKHAKNWGVLGTILLLVGTLMVSGGILTITQGSVFGFLLVMVFCSVGGILTKRTLLIIISTLALSATVGAMAMYGYASYFLVIRQPLITVILFSALGWGSYFFSLRLSADYSHLAIAVSRTSLFLVNFGFWVGSLWGDSLWLRNDGWSLDSRSIIPDWFFAWAWAIALLGTTIWATRQNRRWAVNALSVFGAIHFYTQYFENLGASPISLLIAGIIALGIAVVLARYNRAAHSSVLK